MTEHNNVPLVTITADEYFELRNRAEMNSFYVQKLMELEGSMASFHERLYALEKRNDRT